MYPAGHRRPIPDEPPPLPSLRRTHLRTDMYRNTFTRRRVRVQRQRLRWRTKVARPLRFSARILVAPCAMALVMKDITRSAMLLLILVHEPLLCLARVL